jgi:hypothetical protein
MTDESKFPQGAPWEWGELSPSDVRKLSEITHLEQGPEGPFFQYFAVREVMRLRPAIEAGSGSGFDVLEAVAECARCGLVLPDWLAGAFLKRYRAVSQFRAKSWDDPLSFGPPYPKGTNIGAKRKARDKGLDLYRRVESLRDKNPEMALLEALETVGESMGIGKTLAEEYFYAQRKRRSNLLAGTAADAQLAPFTLGGDEPLPPAKTKKTAGRQKPPR